MRAAIESTTASWETSLTDRNPLLAGNAGTLAPLLRRRDAPGDREKAIAVGVDALRGSGWQVLLQNDPENAVEVARGASRAAERFVGWCVEDGAVDDLVRLLDARRGLVLRSACTSRTASRVLRDHGHEDLAREWEAVLAQREVDGEVGEVRRKVLAVLDDVDGGLTSPATVAEIQDSLLRHGSDALVYLVPRSHYHEGMAVVVPATGAARVSALPLLDVGEGSVLHRYAAAYNAWNAAPTSDGPEHEQWSAALAEACAWAWLAAGEELSGIGEGDPRVVLVPIGLLGLMPWHAAVRAVDGCDRYLVQDVELSTAPSARMFCDLVGRPDVVGGAAVLVGNPARNLIAGATEAAAIRDAHYPDAVLLGSTSTRARKVLFPAGAGTPAQVLDLLDRPVSLLHLACHAEADMRRPLDSAVELAGDRGSLSARTLLEARPTRSADLDVVVLAACATTATGADYDEALSLSTTFLAIGARTVVGSLWRVPAGRSTVHVMALFHHYLRAERLSPATALRRAQLWMLDPDRRFPESVPEHVRTLRQGDGVDAATVGSWAAFVLLGR